MTKPIYPCLWFDNQATEAATFYSSIFPNSQITMDSPMVVHFDLNGFHFMALNGGQNFRFNESVSFVIPCETQEEIDHYWNKLTADGGKESQCGWLKDKYGVSWQVVPSILGDLIAQKGQRVINAFLKMQKFDIETLKNA